MSVCVHACVRLVCQKESLGGSGMVFAHVRVFAYAFVCASMYAYVCVRAKIYL